MKIALSNFDTKREWPFGNKLTVELSMRTIANLSLISTKGKKLLLQIVREENTFS